MRTLCLIGNSHINFKLDDFLLSLGIFHVRGKQPDSSEKTDGGIPIIDKSCTEEYLSTFQSRIETLIQKNTPPLQAELEKLGKRDPEKYKHYKLFTFQVKNQRY